MEGNTPPAAVEAGEAPAPTDQAGDETGQNVAYVSFSAEVIQQTTETLLGACSQLANQGTDVIYLMLSSPGGSVMNGLTIYNVLRGLPCEVVTHNVGNVDSIGNMVFLAGDRRYACRHATFMFHGVGFDVKKKMRFEEKRLRERLDSIQADQDRIGSVIVDRTEITDDEVRELFLEARTRDPDYAMERGIIHDVREVNVPRGAPVHQLVFER